MLALSIILFYCIKQSGIPSSVFSILVLSPLLFDRQNIRPELFGYVIFCLFLYIFLSYPKTKKYVWSIPLLMALWINLHISFVFGILMIFLFMFRLFFEKKKKLFDFLPFLISFPALLINPYGIQGALYPFYIFRNYGYTIAENQNMFFLNSLFFSPFIRYFFILTPIVFISFFILLYKKKIYLASLLMSFFFLSLWQIRHIPFFIYVAIPSFSYVLFFVGTYVEKRIKNLEDIRIILYSLLFLSVGIGLYISISNFVYNAYDLNRRFGLGFSENAKSGVEFLKKNRVPGPMFNNFDAGGYLAYRLYPEYKVFVDNRPEAYPATFFRDVYIPMQTDKKLREEIFNRYKIKTIFFTHTDQTEWARAFIESVYDDTSWKLIYLDESVLVFSRYDKLPDIRKDDASVKLLIQKETDYYNLLNLSHILYVLKKNSLAGEAFEKAREINPSSCSIQKNIYNAYISTPYLQYRAKSIRENYWYCF